MADIFAAIRVIYGYQSVRDFSELIDFYNDTAAQANNGSVEDQLDCFGMGNFIQN